MTGIFEMGPGQGALVQIAAAGAVYFIFTFLCGLMVPSVSAWLVRLGIGKADKVQKACHDFVHRGIAAGWVHNAIQIPLAIWILSEPHMRADPIYATDPKANVMLLVGCGYFVFDLYICTTGFKTEGPGFLLHAVCCFTAFVYARASGFLHAYAAGFLLWELSTPFVHARWFMYKLGMETHRAYLINGLLMLVAFFGCRNVLGPYMSYRFFIDSQRELDSPRPGGFPAFAIWVYRFMNVSLNCLNAYWFYKMFAKALATVMPAKTAAVMAKKAE